jgi:hypothetical protein
LGEEESGEETRIGGRADRGGSICYLFLRPEEGRRLIYVFVVLGELEMYFSFMFQPWNSWSMAAGEGEEEGGRRKKEQR